MIPRWNIQRTNSNSNFFKIGINRNSSATNRSLYNDSNATRRIKCIDAIFVKDTVMEK